MPASSTTSSQLDTSLLRNSRIRQGLSLDAPLYFPGHGTRLFYRVTNVSGGTITLDKSKGIAQVAFQHVEGTVAHPYHGAFSDELDFNGICFLKQGRID